MTNRSKNIGTEWESRNVKYAHSKGFLEAQRVALAGSLDRGDIRLCPSVVLECKATRAFALSTAVKEADREAVNAGARWGVACIKRPNYPVAKGYIVMTNDVFYDILNELKKVGVI